MKSAKQVRRQEIKRLERKRTILNWVEAILYAAFIIFCIRVISTHEPVEKTGQVIEHTVKQGENLTQIASKYSDDYVLKAVADIKKLNGMKESDLQVGQTLKIVIK